MLNGCDHAFRRLALPLCALLALTGCATGGSTSAEASGGESTPAETGTSEELPAHRQLGYRLEWRGFPVTADRAEIDTVEVFDDLLVVRDSANTISAVEISTGVNRWATQAGDRLDRVYGLARSPGGEVLVSSDTELMFYDAKTGTLERRQRYDQLVSTGPVIIGRYACVGCENGQLLIHNMTSGFRQHAYDFGATIEVSPVEIDGFVGAVARNGRVFVIDPNTGSSIGRTRVYDEADAPPASSATAMFVASRDQSLWAFEARGGKTRWRVRTQAPVTHPPVYAGGVVYCVIPEKGLGAYDAITGEELWTADGVFADAVCRRGDRIIAWDGNTVYAVQASSGDVMNTFELTGVDRLIASEFEEGDLYTVSTANDEIRRHVPIR